MDTTNPVMTRIAITPSEWAETRKRAIDAGLRTSEYLAIAVRRQNIAAKSGLATGGKSK